MEIKFKLPWGSMAACCCMGACGNRLILELPCDRCGGLSWLIPSTRDNVRCLTATVQSSLRNEMNLQSCSLKYANESCHDGWLPLNFGLGHRLTEITEVESRLLSAARPWPFFCHLLDLISFE